jgi:hypothetical protein
MFSYSTESSYMHTGRACELYNVYCVHMYGIYHAFANAYMYNDPAVCIMIRYMHALRAVHILLMLTLLAGRYCGGHCFDGYLHT